MSAASCSATVCFRFKFPVSTPSGPAGSAPWPLDFVSVSDLEELLKPSVAWWLGCEMTCRNLAYAFGAVPASTDVFVDFNSFDINDQVCCGGVGRDFNVTGP